MTWSLVGPEGSICLTERELEMLALSAMHRRDYWRARRHRLEADYDYLVRKLNGSGIQPSPANEP